MTLVNVAAIWHGHSAEDLDGGGSDGGEGDTQGTARTPDAQCKRLDMIWVPEWAPSCSWEDAGQDPIINVALAYGFADIEPTHKSQRTQAGSPASDQSRIWQAARMVAHGRGMGPFEICIECRVWASEVPSHAILVWRADQPRIRQVDRMASHRRKVGVVRGWRSAGCTRACSTESFPQASSFAQI